MRKKIMKQWQQHSTKVQVELALIGKPDEDFEHPEFQAKMKKSTENGISWLCVTFFYM